MTTTNNATQQEIQVRRPVHGRGRGFASMSPEKRREISSLGGKIAHRYGKPHRWTSEEAQRAGRIGGAISRKRGPNKNKSQPDE